MPRKVRVFVPADLPDSQDVVEYVRRTLSEKYGGTTTFEADGAYISNDGDVIENNVSVVEAIGTREPIDESHVSKVLSTIRTELNQEAVLAEIVEVETVSIGIE